ncbi:MAG: energy transducer TonB [Bacteroidetes bacterium]|nr:energy transducer TonB [Bacteroidota bacterium]
MKRNLEILLLIAFCGLMNGSLIGQKSPETTSSEPGIVQAQPRGGMKKFSEFIADNFKYPTRCQSEGINGYVLLKFIVELDGSLSNFEVIEDTKACPEFAKEAIRVMKKSPKWKPAMKNGAPIRHFRLLPIKLEVA